MARHALMLAALGVGLAGCSGMLSEDNKYYLKKDWDQLRMYDWRSTADQVESGIWPSPTQREAEAEKKICLHKNGENRVVTQNGVSDAVEYKHCVLADYPSGMAAGGGRLTGRADGVSWPD